MNFDHADLGHEGVNSNSAQSARSSSRRRKEEGQSDFESTGLPAHEFVRRRWMKYETAQRIVGNNKILRRITVGLFAQLELLILGGHKDPAILRAIRRCRRQSESLLTGNEAFFLYSVAYAQRILDCPMAVVGVFQGSSARIICEAKGERHRICLIPFPACRNPERKKNAYSGRGNIPAL